MIGFELSPKASPYNYLSPLLKDVWIDRPLWCWDQSKIEVGRTVIAGNIL